jgi:AraC-like DNA-binding protein
VSIAPETRPTISAALRPWIAEVDVLTTDNDRQPLVHLPDAATMLVFRTTAEHRSDLVVLGPRTRAEYHTGKLLPFCVRLRIRPGCARALLGQSISDLVDRVIPLGALWGEAGDRLSRELVDLGNDPNRVLRHIEATLLDRLAAQTARDLSRSKLLHSATQALSARGSSQPDPLRAIADRLSISERHLRNLFAGEVGLSPQRFARIDRVRGVLASAGRRQWAQLANDTGYYDQAHMITEFRAMMGVPPGAFAAGRLPAAHPC